MTDNALATLIKRHSTLTFPVSVETSVVRPRYPASRSQARRGAEELVGVETPAIIAALRDWWWDQLAVAVRPDEKRACAWMIDELGVAIGLAEHERAAAVMTVNGGRAARAARREAELDRWERSEVGRAVLGRREVRTSMPDGSAAPNGGELSEP